MARTQIDLGVQAQDGTLTNAQVAAAAAIAHSKLANATAGQVLLANSGGAITATTIGGDITVSNAGDAQLVAGAIVNADINAAAAIEHSKLATITAGQVLLGNASNVPTATAVTGDIGITSAGVVSISSGVIVDADVNASAAIATSKLADSANFLLRNASNTLAATTKFAYASQPASFSDLELVDKQYVDSVATGLDLKDAVRLATTSGSNLPLTGAATVDGSAVVTGDRILVKDQTLPAQNGIYVANTAGAWSRSPDADNTPGAEVSSGMFCFVTSGTLNANNGFVLATPNPIVLDTTPLTFTQFSGAGQVTAGAGLTKTGNQIDVVAADGIQVNADSIEVKLDGATLAKGVNGLKLSDLASANILVGNGSNVATGVPVTGDVTLLNTGATTVTDLTITGETTGDLLYRSAGGIWTRLAVGGANQTLMGGTTPAWVTLVTRELATRVNSTQYTIANAPKAGSEEVYVNGVLQNYGAGNDYQVSAANINFENALQLDDVVLVSYRY